MITLTRITQPSDPLLGRLMPLYTEAFPPEERRQAAQLEKLLHTEQAMFFNAVECEGKLAGLFVYWNFGSFYYLEHLAVFAEMRNKNIGQQILDWAKEHLNGVRLLEVEPAEDEMTTRRVNYYQRNGYMILDQSYIQPAYDGKGEACPLWIMGNRQPEEACLLKEQIGIIKNRVYYRQ